MWTQARPTQVLEVCLAPTNLFCLASWESCSYLLLQCAWFMLVGQIPYGEVGHLEPGANEVYHTMFFQNIYHIGDTKSAQELEVFLRMPKERLRLGRGIQCTDTLHPLGPKNVPSCTLLHYDFCGLPSWVCQHWEWWAVRTETSYTAPFEASWWPCTGNSQRGSPCLVWRPHWHCNQWCIWCRKNSPGCCPACRVTGLWPKPPTHGPHQGERGCPCGCWAPGCSSASWAHPAKDGTSGPLLWTTSQRLLDPTGHSPWKPESAPPAKGTYHCLWRWFPTRMRTTLQSSSGMDGQGWPCT